jgi:hypothetical protein
MRNVNSATILRDGTKADLNMASPRLSDRTAARGNGAKPALPLPGGTQRSTTTQLPYNYKHVEDL